jgi:hypothetical protein
MAGIAAMVLVSAAVPVSAAVDPTVRAGAQTSPDDAFISRVAACSRHVATSGNNANDGKTVQTAWRTLAKAMQSLTAGQTACVHSGTYQEAALRAVNSGTSVAPITIMGAPGEARPSVVATTDHSLFDVQPGIGYWVVQGFDINKNQTNGASVRVLGGHHVAVRNNVIRAGKSGAAVLLTNGAQDVVVEGNEIKDHQRWQHRTTGAIAYVRQTLDFQRADANAINVEGVDVARVRIRANHLHHNGGDGFQCLGAQDDVGPSSRDGRDIDLVDNRVNANTENAMDVKSCQWVSIRGSVSPAQSGSAANNKFFDYRPTDLTADRPGNNSNGAAIVIHYHARHVLVENTRVWAACEGIAVGREDAQVVDLIIRRNLFFDLTSGERCAGRGVRLSNASRVDLYHNTFDNVPTEAITVKNASTKRHVMDDIDVWNTIVSRAATWLRLDIGTDSVTGQPTVTNVESDHNLLWHPDGSSTHFRLNGSLVTLDTWRARTGHDHSSRVADPRFVPTPQTNDYFTESTSPARDTAVPNTGTSFCGAGPDRGFRESGCP